MKRTAEEGRKVVRAEEILEKIERGEPVEYDGVIVEGDLDLSRVNLDKDDDGKFIINSQINIWRSDITNFVRFGKASFHKQVWFKKSKFVSGAYFGYSQFHKDTVFTDAHFCDNAFFSGIQFGEGAYFGNVQFIESAGFRDAKFNGTAKFLDSQFEGETNFQRTQFNGYAGFFNARFCKFAQFTFVRFNEKAEFQEAEFYKDADFRNSQFGKDAEFANSRFGGDVNFTNAKFNDYLDFSGTKFENDLILMSSRIRKMRLSDNFSDKSTILLIDADFDQIKNIRWDSIKKHLDYEKNGGITYLKLVENFKNLGFFDDADNCYYEHKRSCQRNTPLSIQIILNYIFRYSYGYGVKPFYVIPFSILLIVIFGYIFWWLDLFNDISRINLSDNTLAYDLIRIFSKQNPIYSLIASINQSVSIFLLGDWSDLSGIHRKVAIIEGFSRWVISSLFVIFLARKLIR